MDTGCIVLLLIVIVGAALFTIRTVEEGSRYVTSKKIDNSMPHNWVIVESSGVRWTTYSLTPPNVRRGERGRRTYVYSLDELHKEAIWGDECSAVVYWKYSGVKVVSKGFSKEVEDSDGNVVYWGNTPQGIGGDFSRIGSTFWKDTEDGIARQYFFTEEKVRQRAESLPIDIVSIEYRDLRNAKY